MTSPYRPPVVPHGDRPALAELLRSPHGVALSAEAADVAVLVRSAMGQRHDVVRHGRLADNPGGGTITAERFSFKSAKALSDCLAATKSLRHSDHPSIVGLDFRQSHCDLGGYDLFRALAHSSVSRCQIGPQQLRKLLHDFCNDSSVISARHAGPMLWMAWSRKPKQQRPEAFAPGAVVNSLFRKPYTLALPASTLYFHFII